MRRILRWGGLAISIGTYLALTIWSNTSGAERALAAGEESTRSAMQPFWWLIYLGIAMLVASWFLPRTPRSPSTHGEKLDSKPEAKTADLPARPFEPLSEEAAARAVRYLRDQARTGNLRPRKRTDAVEDDPAD